jgi:acyl-CoA dehydrogenase
MNGASAIHLSIFGMGPVVKHGSEELRPRVLPAVAAGELQVAFGVTEPDAGTDTSRITTRATLAADGSHYLVRGRKIWTTKAPHCEKVLLLVRTTARGDVGRPTDGMTLLLADLRRPEVDIVPIDKAGRNAVVSCEVAYDDLPVDVADRVVRRAMVSVTCSTASTPNGSRSSACPRATSSTGRLPGGRSGRSRGSAPVPGDPREPPSRPSVRP